MLTLTLFRHAKSSWKSEANSDHDRPLNKRGMRDAPYMGQRLLERECLPDRCLVSTSRRTRETVAALIDSGVLATNQVEFIDRLYLASADTILDVVQNDFLEQASAPKHVMVIAHNPGLEILGDKLSTQQIGAMPTAAVASFSLEATDFSVVHSANAALEFYIFPKD